MGKQAVVEHVHMGVFSAAIGVLGIRGVRKVPRRCPEIPQTVGQERGSGAVEAEDEGEA